MISFEPAQKRRLCFYGNEQMFFVMFSRKKNVQIFLRYCAEVTNLIVFCTDGFACMNSTRPVFLCMSVESRFSLSRTPFTIQFVPMKA